MNVTFFEVIQLNPSIHSFFSKVRIWKCWMLKSHDVGGWEKTYYIEFFLLDWWPWDNLIIIQHLSISIAAPLKSQRWGFNKTLILHCHCDHVYPVRITVWLFYIFWQLNRNSCSNESRFRCSNLFPRKYLWNRLHRLPESPERWTSQPYRQEGISSLESSNHSLFILCPKCFSGCTDCFELLVKMFWNVCLHCPGFVTRSGS